MSVIGELCFATSRQGADGYRRRSAAARSASSSEGGAVSAGGARRRARGALAAELRERELDVLLVDAPVNVRYLTGFTGTNGWR